MTDMEFADAAVAHLQMAATLIRDLANGWPVGELAQHPDAWRDEVEELLARVGAELDEESE